MSVKFLGGDVLHPGKPVLLFEDKRNWGGFDVAPDGRLVVAREADDRTGRSQINVILHWFEELRQQQQK